MKKKARFSTFRHSDMVHRFGAFMLRYESVSIFVILVLMSLCLYANSLQGAFVFDDQFITDRADLHTPASMLSAWTQPFLPGNPHAGMYRPIPIVTFAMNFLVFGSSPISFHIVSVLLHALTSFVLFLVVRRLFQHSLLACVVAVLFVFLPIHTEAVDYVKARDELLSTFFVLLSWFAFLRVTDSKKKRSFTRFFPSALFFLCAVLSKEFAIVTPAIFFLVEWAKRGRTSIRRFLSDCTAYIVAIVFYIVLRAVALGGDAFSTQENLMLTMNPLSNADVWTRIWTAFKLAFLAIGKTVIPVHLTATYSFNHVPLASSPFASWQVIGGMFLIIGFILAACLRRFRGSALGTGVIVFLVTYFPMSKFFFAKKLDMFGERWMYLPSVGISMMMAYAFIRLWARHRVLSLITLIALLSVYGSVVVVRNRDWRTEESLYKSMIRTSPNAVVGYTNLAKVHMLAGDFVSAKNEITHGLQITEEHPPLLQLLGLLAVADQQYNIAWQAFDAASQIFPDDEASFIYLAAVASKQHEYDQAIQILQSHFSTSEYAPIRFLLSLNYSRTGQAEKAAEYMDWDTQAPEFRRYFTFPPAATMEEKQKILDEF